jgi:hypothetical protein
LEPFVRDEEMLVGHAQQLEVDDFAHVVARWMLFADPDGADPGKAKPSEWHVSEMLAGRRRVDGELDLEDSVEYTAELDRLYEQVWQEDHAPAASEQERNRTRSQRYAAAQIEMARRSANANDEGHNSRKPLFVVKIDLDALVGDGECIGELDDGTLVPSEIVRRWLCDSAVSRVITYIATDGQRRALKVRDGKCIVPGCDRPAKWCQAHHVVPWPKGPTNLHNLVLLCSRHHKQVHRGIIKIVSGERLGTFIVTKADGTPVHQRPPPVLTAA